MMSVYLEHIFLEFSKKHTSVLVFILSNRRLFLRTIINRYCFWHSSSFLQYFYNYSNFEILIKIYKQISYYYYWTQKMNMSLFLLTLYYCHHFRNYLCNVNRKIILLITDIISVIKNTYDLFLVPFYILVCTQYCDFDVAFSLHKDIHTYIDFSLC